MPVSFLKSFPRPGVFGVGLWSHTRAPVRDTPRNGIWLLDECFLVVTFKEFVS